MQKLILVKPAEVYQKSFLAGYGELSTQLERSAWVYLGDDEDLDAHLGDFPAYLKTLRGRELKTIENPVPFQVYWGLLDHEIVGRIGIRTELNDFFKTVGGHVGFFVRPSFRKRGIATAMLAEILKTEAAKAIGKILVTCDSDNIASEKTIVSCGGVFESEIEHGGEGRKKKRFWINL